MIELKNISKNYDQTIALNDVSISIETGQLVTLIGPSGCGKSTLLRIINRMIEPTSGELRINGTNALDLDPVALRRSIGYVIQSAGLFPHLTVQQNVEVVPELLGWDKNKRKQRALELLEVVGLDPDQYAERYPNALSGGQLQRVGIARALAADPSILLMDEPFSAVDPITREQLQAELLRIQSNVKKTIVFVTHDIDEAISLGDKVALLRAGQIIQYSPPIELLSEPIDEFTGDFLGNERELKRLNRLTVADIIVNNSIQLQKIALDHNIHTPTVSLNSNARVALSKLLSGIKFINVVNDQQQVIAQLQLQHFVDQIEKVEV